MMVYGTGTRSYNRSPEKRAMDQERKAFNEKLERGEITFEPLTLLLCHCRSFRFGHEPSAHKQLKSDYDWRPWEQRRNDSPAYWDQYERAM